MRGYHLSLVLSLVLTVSLFGCPWVSDRAFTTADRFGGNYYGPEDAAGGEGEGEGEGDAPADERDVVEPDVIRQDGDLLYVLNQYRGLSIVDLDGEAVLAQLPTYGYPRDLYLVGDRAYVLVGYARDAVVEGDAVRIEVGSRLYVADVSDPANAAIVTSFGLEGDLVDSRLVGDVLYAVSAHYTWYAEDDVVMKKQTSESWVTSVAVGDPGNITVVDKLSIPGTGNTIQVTSEAIFVASPEWYWQDSGASTVSYIDISDPAGTIAAGGSVNIPGYIADRFKMDAQDGVLRVVSSTHWPDREVYVTTVSLDDPANPAILGQTSLENASGETLFAVRFDGDRVYIVTYLIVDPLFVVDLSDPVNPTVSGELMVPGWSTHIEIVDGRLVALGVDDTDGRKVKVSLYDVDNPQAPAEVDTVSFGEGWAWSTAFNDVKAFTVLDDTLIVPTSGWDETSGQFDRMQFISYDRNDLTLRGAVDLQGNILRSFHYENRYYGVTTEQVGVIEASDLDDPDVVNTITLAEYLYDYFELGGDYYAAVIAHTEQSEAVVRVETADGTPMGEVAVSLEGLLAVERSGSRVALVGMDYDPESYQSTYRVVIVDCADPADPAAVADLPLDFNPWWGYCYWCWGPEGVDDEGWQKQFADIAYYRPWGGGEDSALVAGDYLALRGYAENYGVTLGEDEVREGLALIDMAKVELVETVGLGYEQVVSVDAAGDKIYIGTKESLPAGPGMRPECALYISELDPASVTMGAAVNVPGTFLQYSPASGVLVLRDWQYSGGVMEWNVTQSLRTVLWQGGDVETVMPVDEFVLPDYTGTLVAARSRIYYEEYGEGPSLSAVHVSSMGRMAAGGSLDTTAASVSLLAGKDTTAVVSYGGGALATYDFTAAPALTNLVETMGWPTHVRFGESNAYAPLGYAGLATLPY